MERGIHIIAEAGTNHNGDLNKAKKLVDIAEAAGADSVKFQIIYPWGLYLPGEYEYGNYDIKEVIRIREEGMMTDDEYSKLVTHASQKGIACSASIFDQKGLDLLEQFDPPYIKMASCDLNNIRLLRQVAERGRKMVLSTGMSSLEDIELSLEQLAKENFDDIVLLHCVSVYPASLEQTNLTFLDKLKEFGFPIGFSDHTGDSQAALMALARGAVWFEKHYTEDRTQQGFDHAYALEASELAAYVSDLRTGLKAIEEVETKISDKEAFTRKRARRSLYASRDLEVGHTLTDADVLCVRPEGILDANQIDAIIGKKLIAPIRQHEAFAMTHVE